MAPGIALYITFAALVFEDKRQREIEISHTASIPPGCGEEGPAPRGLGRYPGGKARGEGLLLLVNMELERIRHAVLLDTPHPNPAEDDMEHL